MDAAKITEAQRALGRNAAVLLLLGLLAGGLVAGAMTGQVNADRGALLASHLNALLGCFWMVAVAATMPWLRYGDVGLRRLAWATTLPNVANWAVTAAKAFLKVAGVGLTGVAANDAIFVALNLFVVLPSLVAAGAWVYGFGGATHGR